MDDETSEARPGRGSVGNEIFDQVEKLMAEEGLSRTNAFQRLSEMTGRRAGTVAANYYRVARQRGAALQPRAPRGSRSGGAGGRRGRGRRGAAAGGDVDAALQRVMDAVQELGNVVRAQQKEIDELREQAEVVAKMRSLVGGR